MMRMSRRVPSLEVIVEATMPTAKYTKECPGPGGVEIRRLSFIVVEEFAAGPQQPNLPRRPLRSPLVTG